MTLTKEWIAQHRAALLKDREQLKVSVYRLDGALAGLDVIEAEIEKVEQEAAEADDPIRQEEEVTVHTERPLVDEEKAAA